MKNKELSFIKKIEILSCGFSIKYDKTHNGGYFSLEKSIIEIGVVYSLKIIKQFYTLL